MRRSGYLPRSLAYSLRTPDMTQSVPILNALLHPPLGALRREVIPGLFSGVGDLTRATGALPPFDHVNAYGLTWSFFTVPDTIGFTWSDPRIYEEPMLFLSTIHTGFDGHDLVSEYHTFQAEGIYWLWDNPGPTRVHYEVRIGVEAVLYWIIVKLP